jgi:hypothetical protein
MEIGQWEAPKANSRRIVNGPGLAFGWRDVVARPSMSLSLPVVSVRLYDADDHQVMS